MLRFIICASSLFLLACSNQSVQPVLKKPLPALSAKSAKPIRVEQPCFPGKAIRNNAEGWVQVEFSIDRQGRATDIAALDDSPPGLFTPCALSSIKQWIFEIPADNHTKNRYQFVFEFRLG